MNLLIQSENLKFLTDKYSREHNRDIIEIEQDIDEIKSGLKNFLKMHEQMINFIKLNFEKEEKIEENKNLYDVDGELGGEIDEISGGPNEWKLVVNKKRKKYLQKNKSSVSDEKNISEDESVNICINPKSRNITKRQNELKSKFK